MNTEELAFFNQQLAGMLRSGVPLEGALKELTRDLHRGTLKTEIQQLEDDLSKGLPLTDAIDRRAFPPLYRRLIRLGAQSGQLEETLLLIADHYHRASMLWNRIKALAFYPIITLTAGFLLSLFLAVTLRAIPETFLTGELASITTLTVSPLANPALTWVAPAVFGSLLTLCLAGLLIPRLRHRIAWQLPGFREASLAQTATACQVLLKGGLSLEETLTLVREMESNRRAKADLSTWLKRLSEGHDRFSQAAQDSRAFPPLFVWLVASFEEAISEGFEKAAQIYRRRAEYRVEILLNAAVPVSILFIGALVMLSVMPAIQMLLRILTAIDALGA